MRGIVYVLILASLFFVPLERMQISQMLPVSAVAIRQEDGDVVIETDRGTQGRGATVADAITAMQETTPAVIYLDTAKYLLVAENAVEHVEAVRQYIKGSVKACITDDQSDLEGAVRYLDIHGDLPRLRDLEQE